MRICGNCYREKAASAFRPNPIAHGGLHPNCKICQNDLTGKKESPEPTRKNAVRRLGSRIRVDK